MTFAIQTLACDSDKECKKKSHQMKNSILLLAFVVVTTCSAGTIDAQQSEISIDFREAASNIDVDLTILEGETAGETIQLCTPSCYDWTTGLGQGELEFNLYRLETMVSGGQGHMAVGQNGLSIELLRAVSGDKLAGQVTFSVHEPLIDLTQPVNVELLFSVNDSEFDSLETTVNVINLTDGGSDGQTLLFSQHSPSTASFPLFLPADDPPLDPFLVGTNFELSGTAQAAVVVEGIRIEFTVPEPSGMSLFLLAAFGLVRNRSPM